MPRAINIAGEKFGRLLAIKPTVKRDGWGKVKWECLCDCGNTFFVESAKLVIGNTMSCGCIRRLGLKNDDLPIPERFKQRIVLAREKAKQKRKETYSLSGRKEKHRIEMSKWRSENPGRSSDACHKCYWKNPDRARRLARESRARAKLNPERTNRIRKYAREKMARLAKENSNHAIRKRLRTRIIMAIKQGGGEKSVSTIRLLGCSIAAFKEHLESKFTNGMTWDNYGFRGWHIDHIIPCNSFDLTKIEQQQKCFHYTNTQPLWWSDNLSKGHKVSAA